MWAWGAFGLFILAMLALDLGVLNRNVFQGDAKAPGPPSEKSGGPGRFGFEQTVDSSQ